MFAKNVVVVAVLVLVVLSMVNQEAVAQLVRGFEAMKALNTPFRKQPSIPGELRLNLQGQRMGAFAVVVRGPVFHDPLDISAFLKGERTSWGEILDFVQKLPILPSAPTAIEATMAEDLRKRIEEHALADGLLVVKEACAECLYIQPHIAFYHPPEMQGKGLMLWAVTILYEGVVVASSRQRGTVAGMPTLDQLGGPKSMSAVGKIAEYEAIAVWDYVFGPFPPAYLPAKK